MRTRARNILIPFILGIFCVNIFFPIVLCVSVEYVRIEQKEFIRENFGEEKMFSEMILSEAEFQQYGLENADEFEWEGKMYDIHSISRKDGKYIVKVKGDEKETDLKRVQVVGQAEQSSKAGVFFATALFFEKVAEITFPTPILSLIHYSYDVSYLPVNVKVIQGPPPDLKA